jgi:hypothetical protein
MVVEFDSVITGGAVYGHLEPIAAFALNSNFEHREESAVSPYTLICTAHGLDPAFCRRSAVALVAEHPINRIRELLR